MYDTNTKECYGKCLLSNMFAIPYKELIAIDITSFDETTLSIMEKKLEYLKRNLDRITKAANRLYKQKIKNYKQEYLKATVDFIKIETMAINWETMHYGKHYNRFPDNDFFLTNPFTEGISDYYLMNKNTKIAKISIDNTNQSIIKIKEIISFNFAPMECFKNKKLNQDEMTKWFKGRGIPSCAMAWMIY